VTMTILDALDDVHLLGASFRDAGSWSRWRVALAALFGLRMTAEAAAVYGEHTGRTMPPAAPAREAWFIVGRRGGKSRIAAAVAVYLACFRDYGDLLAPGERGTLALIAADRQQARTVFRYIVGLLDASPMLARLIERRTADSIDLVNHVTIEVHTANFRSIRGYSIVAAVLDEIAFWRSEDSVNPDREIVGALRPAMATVPGALLVAISSPYARRGVLWDAYRRHYRQDGDVLVWQAPTQIMNPAVPARVIADAYAADAAVAAAEYGAEFRSDLEAFVPREVVDACTILGRCSLPPQTGVRYYGFTDPSGGSADSFTLAIAHRAGHGEAEDAVVIDAVEERRAPCNPADVVAEFAALLSAYEITRVTGDRYAGEWPREAFRRHGIAYEPAERPKSDLYRDLLPRLTSQRVALPDNARLGGQLCALERRTGRSGRDTIDHPPGGHDDLANAVAGAVVLAGAGARNSFLFMDAPAQAPRGYGDQIREAMPEYFDRGIAANPAMQCGTCVNRRGDGWCRLRLFTVAASLPACEFHEPIQADHFRSLR
jgi:hypothetical protein